MATRQQRRALERAEEKNRGSKLSVLTNKGGLSNIFKKLDKKDIDLINKAISDTSKEQAEKAFNTMITRLMEDIDLNFSATLIAETDLDIDTIAELCRKFIYIYTADNIKKQDEYREKFGGDYVKKINGLENEVRDFIMELLEKNLSKKQIMDQVAFNFNSLSKSNIANAYGKVRKEYLEKRGVSEGRGPIIEETKQSAKEKVEEDDIKVLEVAKEDKKANNKPIVDINEPNKEFKEILSGLNYKIDSLTKEREIALLKIDEFKEVLQTLEGVVENADIKINKIKSALEILVEV